MDGQVGDTSGVGGSRPQPNPRDTTRETAGTVHAAANTLQAGDPLVAPPPAPGTLADAVCAAAFAAVAADDCDAYDAATAAMVTAKTAAEAGMAVMRDAGVDDSGNGSPWGTVYRPPPPPVMTDDSGAASYRVGGGTTGRVAAAGPPRVAPATATEVARAMVSPTTLSRLIMARRRVYYGRPPTTRSSPLPLGQRSGGAAAVDPRAAVAVRSVEPRRPIAPGASGEVVAAAAAEAWAAAQSAGLPSLVAMAAVAATASRAVVPPGGGRSPRASRSAPAPRVQPPLASTAAGGVRRRRGKRVVTGGKGGGATSSSTAAP